MIRVLIALLLEQMLHRVNNVKEIGSLFCPQNLQLQTLPGALAVSSVLTGIEWGSSRPLPHHAWSFVLSDWFEAHEWLDGSFISIIIYYKLPWQRQNPGHLCRVENNICPLSRFYICCASQNNWTDESPVMHDHYCWFTLHKIRLMCF